MMQALRGTRGKAVGEGPSGPACSFQESLGLRAGAEGPQKPQGHFCLRAGLVLQGVLKPLLSLKARRCCRRRLFEGSYLVSPWHPAGGHTPRQPRGRGAQPWAGTSPRALAIHRSVARGGARRQGPGFGNVEHLLWQPQGIHHGHPAPVEVSPSLV